MWCVSILIFTCINEVISLRLSHRILCCFPSTLFVWNAMGIVHFNATVICSIIKLKTFSMYDVPNIRFTSPVGGWIQSQCSPQKSNMFHCLKFYDTLFSSRLISWSFFSPTHECERHETFSFFDPTIFMKKYWFFHSRPSQNSQSDKTECTMANSISMRCNLYLIDLNVAFIPSPQKCFNLSPLVFV